MTLLGIQAVDWQRPLLLLPRVERDIGQWPELGRYLPSTISMNECLLVAVGHSKRLFRFREEFRTPAGVRKSPKNEPAGCRAGAMEIWDLSACRRAAERRCDVVARSGSRNIWTDWPSAKAFARRWEVVDCSVMDDGRASRR